MTRTQNTMPRHYKQLPISKHDQIEAFRSLQPAMSISEIARRLSRNNSTISRELQRGTNSPNGYQPPAGTQVFC